MKKEKDSCVLNFNMKKNITQRWYCFCDSILDANRKGIDMHIHGYLFIGIKAFIMKKVYLF